MRQGFTPEIELLAKAENLAELVFAAEVRKFRVVATACQVMEELASHLEQCALALEQNMLKPETMRAAARALRAKANREVGTQQLGPSPINNPPQVGPQGGG